MSYATREDLAARYGYDEIEQRESMLATGSVARVLADADAEVDSYLGGRYAVPVATPPAQLVDVVCRIARYKLLGDAASDHARSNFEDARAWLRDVQAGRAVLAGAAVLTGAQPAATVEIVNSRDKVFGGGFA